VGAGNWETTTRREKGEKPEEDISENRGEKKKKGERGTEQNEGIQKGALWASPKSI